VATGANNVYFSLFDGGLACVSSGVGCATTVSGWHRTNIPGVEDPPVVRASLSYACAGLTDAGLLCWGSNLHGALGDGTTTNSMTPARPLGLY